MKEEALALADYLDNNVEAMLFTEQPHLDKASSMIRRLVEELDECWCGGHSYAYLRAKGRLPQTKPLSDDEITNIWQQDNCYGKPQVFARAIEERHGIK